MEQPLCDRELWYTMLLRDPIDRIRSNMHFHGISEDNLQHYLDAGDVGLPNHADNAASLSPSRRLAQSSWWEGWGRGDSTGGRSHWALEDAEKLGVEFLVRGAAASNYQTRHLLGYVGFFLPLDEVDEVHLERAKAVLRRMCVVGLVPHLDELSWAWDSALGYAGPWIDEVDDRGRYPFSHRNRGDAKAALRPTLIARLKLLNAVDASLIQYVRTIASGGVDDHGD